MRPHVDEVVFRVFKSEDPMVQALIKGEIDFVDNLSALQVQSLEGEDGITATSGDSPGFDEIAFNTGSVDLETGEPMGDPNPAVLDPAFRFALNFAIDREQLRPHGLPRRRQDRHHDHPAGLPRLPAGTWTTPTRSPSTSTRPASSSTRPATPRSDGKRTMPNGDPIGTLRLAARSDSTTSPDVMQFFQEWLAEHRHRLGGRDLRVQQADQT